MPDRDLPSSAFDSTRALLRDTYRFIGATCDRLGTDGFRTRLMLRDVVCLRGPEAMDLVYGAEGLTRRGAMPGWALRLLQDKGSVQQLDGAAHRRRKALFLALLVEGDAGTALAGRFRDLWQAAASPGHEINLLHDTSRMLSEAACDWCGLGPEVARDPAIAEALFEMSDRTGRPGPPAARALLRRRRLERRIAGAVVALRHEAGDQAGGEGGDQAADQAGDQAGGEGGGPPTPFAALALHREDGALLAPEVVAVEALNLLRPVVAVGRFIAFAGKALVRHPEWRDRLRREPAMLAPFCEEVRRLAPFFPFTAAIATRPVAWRGVTLPEGQWILADLYGTCHDPALFPDPDLLRPERGLDWRRPAPGFVPQGAGDLLETHRCPGEAVTVALMAEAVGLLCRGDWTAPDQSLTSEGTGIPAQPASGVVIRFGRAG